MLGPKGRAPVFSSALGWLEPGLVEDCHRRGIKVMAMVSTVEDARPAAATGVDVIVAQGGEAGGHRSINGKPASPDATTVGMMALLPQVVDAVRVPVIAAGGIADGRGLVAALALGAQGIQIGTRFVATQESIIADFRKKALLEAESDAPLVTDVVSGLWARYLGNAYIRAYEATGAPVLPVHVQSRFAQDIFDDAHKRQEPEWLPLATGQSAGLIRDLPRAADVVERIVREAEAVLVRWRAMGGAR